MQSKPHIFFLLTFTEFDEFFFVVVRLLNSRKTATYLLNTFAHNDYDISMSIDFYEHVLTTVTHTHTRKQIRLRHENSNHHSYTHTHMFLGKKKKIFLLKNYFSLFLFPPLFNSFYILVYLERTGMRDRFVLNSKKREID